MRPWIVWSLLETHCQAGHVGRLGRLGRQAGDGRRKFFWAMANDDYHEMELSRLTSSGEWLREGKHRRVTQLLHVNWQTPYLPYFSSKSFEWQAEHPDQRHETGQWQLWPCNWKISNKSAWMRHEFDSASGDFELCQDVDVCRCLQDLDEKKDREADAQVLWVVSVDATVPCNIIFVRNMMWYVHWGFTLFDTLNDHKVVASQC